MKVLVAPDSFKGSLTAVQAARAIARGLAQSGIEPVVLPLGDGGEGTVDALVVATDGQVFPVRATGPQGRPVDACWALSGDGQTVFVEMASASGLLLTDLETRDACSATTRGTGELIDAALRSGARRLMVLLGGSATNDGGAGMAQALGYRLLDADGLPVPPGGAGLVRLHTIEPPLNRPWEGITVLGACDVNNPLCGPNGASAVFGPQKGASAQDVLLLDEGLYRLAQVIARDIGIDVLDLPGAGAAGGLGAGLWAFLGARLMPGIEIVLDIVGFDEKIQDTDCVITGEGRTDGQTLGGKVPLGVMLRARKQNIPTVCLSGGLAEGYEELYSRGMTAVLSISQGPGTLEEALIKADTMLAQAALAVGRILLRCRDQS